VAVSYDVPGRCVAVSYDARRRICIGRGCVSLVTAGSLLDDGAMDMLQRGFLTGDCATCKDITSTIHACSPIRPKPLRFRVRGAQSSIASRIGLRKPAKHVVFSGSEGPNLR
jgi:hypothetical protein